MTSVNTTNTGISAARKREVAWLGFSLLLGTLLAIRLGLLFDWAWRINGFIRSSFYDIVASTGINVDVLILVPLGVVLGWVTLFMFDETKRAQKPLLLVSVIIFITVVVIFTNHWTKLKPLKFWYAPICGYALGLLLVLIPHSLSQKKYREYPIAAWALFVVISLAALSALIDFYILNPQADYPSGAKTGVPLAPPSIFSLPTDIIATFGTVLLFGGFLLYRDHHNTILISPDRDGVQGISILTGLFEHTERRFDGAVANKQSGRLLGNARGNLHNGNDPRPIPRGTKVEISYFPGRTWSRRKVLSAKPVGAAQLDDEVILALRKRIKRKNKIKNRMVDIFKPNWVQGLTQDSPESFIMSLATADAAIFVMSVSDFIEGSQAVEASDQLAHPDYITTYEKIASVYQGRQPIVVALLEAEVLEDLYSKEMNVEEVELHGPDFEMYMKEHVVTFGADTIVPITGRKQSGEVMEGAGELRTLIDTLSDRYD